MKLDSIALSAVISDLKKDCIPAKIVDFKQIGKYELILFLKNHNSTTHLFSSVRPDRMAFFQSDSPSLQEIFSSLFFNQLKNWIQGGTLLGVEHPDFDRIVKLIIEPYRSFGLAKRYQLILEFMGKHSNAILTDEENIIRASLKQVDLEMNRYREVKAGIPYVEPPKQEKANPLTISRPEFFKLFNKSINSGSVDGLSQHFQQHLHGMGMKSAREIVAAMGFSTEQKLSEFSEKDRALLWNRFSSLIERIRDNRLSPVAAVDEKTNRIIDYFLLYPMKPKQKVRLIPFQSTSICLEYVYRQLSEENESQNLAQEIRKTLKKNIEKLEEKKQFLDQRIKEIETSEEYKKKGELIKANLWNIKPGMNQITLIDYSDLQHPGITVNLDPALTPIQNAEIYFKKYRKLQQNQDMVDAQWKENLESLNQLMEIRKKFSENMFSPESLSAVYRELVNLKYIQTEKPVKRKTDQAPNISKFLSPDGWTILVGKNSKQNEYLLRTLSAGKDFWLHSLTRPGAHVIIKNHKSLESPPYPTLVFAAKLAGYYSKVKDQEDAQMIYTQRKYVKKPKNAKAGKVTYTHEKTLSVRIDTAEIKQEIRRLETE